MVENLEEKLRPTPMVPETETELRKTLEAEHTKGEPKGPNPRHERVYTFDFVWKDGRGKKWEGTFQNQILSISDRQLVGIMRARMGSNAPVEALDALTRELNLMISHMSFSLIERPDWAKDLRALQDVRLLQALYTEVAEHEATFFGW